MVNLLVTPKGNFTTKKKKKKAHHITEDLALLN